MVSSLVASCLFDLHSTMYLLNLFLVCFWFPTFVYLHSTMYLLNQLPSAQMQRGVPWFTFHYVSIKSINPTQHLNQIYYLHSTMYLLNLHGLVFPFLPQAQFTFHYVSIKSPLPIVDRQQIVWFTFHYVSIKSICI